MVRWSRGEGVIKQIWPERKGTDVGEGLIMSTICSGTISTAIIPSLEVSIRGND